MNIFEIIDKKRLKKNLTKKELEWVIFNYLDNNIDDVKMTALFMAICINGMNYDEIFNLMDICLSNAENIDFNKYDSIIVDQQSIGGINSKETLILAPLVSSCGVDFAHICNHNLEFSSIRDRLVSIPGVNIDLNKEQLINSNEIVKCLVSCNLDLVPIDSKLCYLRESTGTIASIPLIAISLMTRKIASGIDKIVINVIVGNGSIIKNMDDATLLGNILVEIGKHYHKKVIVVITNINEPLGYNIGPTLEIMEVIDTLKGKGSNDINKVVLTLGSYIVSVAKNISYYDAQKELLMQIKNGNAYNKFVEMIYKQGGSIENIKLNSKVISLKSKKTGFIQEIKVDKLNAILIKMGGTRVNRDDEIDFEVGLQLTKKVNDYILEDEELLKVYLGNKDININEILDCFVIDNNPSKATPLIYGVIK